MFGPKKEKGGLDLEGILRFVLIFALMTGFSAGNLTAQDSFGRRVKKFFGGGDSSLPQPDKWPSASAASDAPFISPPPMTLPDAASTKSAAFSGGKNRTHPVAGAKIPLKSEKVNPPEFEDKLFMSEGAGPASADDMIRVAQRTTPTKETPFLTETSDAASGVKASGMVENRGGKRRGTNNGTTNYGMANYGTTDSVMNEAEISDVNFVSAPTDSAPSVSAPSVSAPSVSVPSALVPSVSVLSALAPSALAPSALVPSVTKPVEGEETLEQAWNIAVEASRRLAAKDYERSTADANVRAARGLGLPKVSNVSGVHALSEELAIQTDVPLSQLSPILPDIQLNNPIADKEFATSVTSLTVPIYMGGRVRGMIEAAQAASNAVAFGKRISQQDLKYEVAQTYFLVLRVRRLREVAVEAERTIASHETDAKRLFDNGLVTRNVILAAQVARANAQQDVIKATNAVSLSEAAYNRLLWRSLKTPVRIADVEIPESSGDLNSLTAEAVSRRPELAALAYKSQALAAEAKVHRADRLPQVAAVGSHNYIENSHLNENSTFSGSLGVIWMPFDGGVSRNRQEASSFEAMSVTREHEDAQSKIELQVYQCWLEEEETRHRVEVAQKGVDQADENLRIVTGGFKEGLANHTEVLDAQTLRTQAWSNLANARYDAILATYHLRRAVGEL